MDFISRPGPLRRDMGLRWQWVAVLQQGSLCRDKVPRQAGRFGSRQGSHCRD